MHISSIWWNPFSFTIVAACHKSCQYILPLYLWSQKLVYECLKSGWKLSSVAYSALCFCNDSLSHSVIVVFADFRVKVLVISNANELVRIKPERIVYVVSDGNYSTMVLHDKTEQVFTMNLAHFQQMIEEQLGKEAMTFIRIGKQLIVNRAYIFKINPNKQQLIMSDMDVNIAFDLQASKEALKQLKALLESQEGKL